ncbi:MAG TPA: carbohydrate kinase family protein [Kofleriaceae bacterium]|nr:carbohydrate kinase family protein [Kofleriaceae bacterium]
MVVVGDALLDVVARPSMPLGVGGDVPGSVELHPGGQGANVAVRLARRGLTVRLVSAMADDAAGRLLHDLLTHEGLELATVPVEASGSVVVLVDAAGERTMLSQRSAFAGLVGVELLEGPSRRVVVSGYLLLERQSAALVDRLASLPTEVVVLGCAIPEPPAAVGWWRNVKASGAALVVVNAAEARVLRGGAPGDEGADDEAALAEALSASIGSVVVVTGTGGAAAAGPGGALATVAPATGAGPVIDSTGAGDAFSAALIAALVGGADVSAALHAGVSLAAAVARVEGAQTRVASEPGGTLDA